MRWFMLPVSAAAHVAAFLVTLIVPLATGVDAPTPWPASSNPDFLIAAPAPLPPIVRTAAGPVTSTGAPTEAPDGIVKDPPEPPAGPPVGAIGEPVGSSIGVPDGLDSGITSLPLPAPPPAPVPPAAYRTGGMIREPRKVAGVAPVYPEAARLAKIEGIVILEATIDERGIVTDARVLRSIPLLDAAALAALKQWRYTPTLLNGVPVRVLMTVTFRFTLGDL
jgi:protein TonB